MSALPEGPRGRRSATRAGRRGSAAAVVCGLVLLLLAGFQLWRERPVTEAGAAQVRQLSEVPGRQAQPPAGNRRPAPTPRRPPVALRIPAIGLVTEVTAIGVDPASGELDLPAADRAGWYRSGPGLEVVGGSVVIAGHVDTRDGPGAFFQLAGVSPGDQVILVGAAGERRTFRVVGREVYHKAELPVARYFTRAGAARLSLITCTGPFDDGDGGYRDNVVVTAIPVSG